MTADRLDSKRALSANRRSKVTDSPFRAAPADATPGDRTMAWPHEACANEPVRFTPCGESNALWSLGARLVLALFLLAVVSPVSRAAVRGVEAIGITVDNLDREIDFYTRVLGFEVVAQSVESSGASDDLLGLSGTELRQARLRLGDEHFTLTEHLTNKGRAIPSDSRSFDHWFQHIAIVVSDMDAAYAHLRQTRVRHVSTGPQTLPAWNKEAGGIRAFYFRDPEDHVLEIIWFPPGKGAPKWQRAPVPGSQAPWGLFLGIDHTAIVVSDTERSLAFYRDLLGMSVAGTAENHGMEQEHLNQVFGARLRITALRTGQGPGIEFLEYIAPPGGRPLPPDAKANDLLFWTTELAVDDPATVRSALLAHDTAFVTALPSVGSPPSAPTSPLHSSSPSTFIARDPDGHALLLRGACGVE